MSACDSPRHSERHARGVTLVELLVVLAVGGVVLALTLRTFDSTQRLALREVARNELRQDASLAMHRITTILADAVPLTALDVSAEATELFIDHRLRVASWSSATADGITVHDVFEVPTLPRDPEAEEESEEMVSLVPEDPHEMAESYRVALANYDLAGESVGSLVTIGEDISLDFEYCTDPSAPQWVPRLPAGEFPALVRVTLSGILPGREIEPFTLSTVVATGLEVRP